MKQQILNIKNLLIILLVSLVLTGCFHKKEGESTGEGTSTQKKKEAKEEGYSGNLEKMMGLGIPLKCTFKKDESYYGTSWVKGKSSYSEITMEGKTANVIWKDSCMWNWEKGNPQGTKMCMEISEEEMEKGMEESRIIMDQQGYQTPNMDYKCLPAVISDSKFNPPGNINFMDLEEMMMQGFGD